MSKTILLSNLLPLDNIAIEARHLTLHKETSHTAHKRNKTMYAPKVTRNIAWLPGVGDCFAITLAASTD